MQFDLSLLEAFGTVFFFLLFLVATYLYQHSENKEEKGPLLLAVAMLFFFIRELLYFLAGAAVLANEARFFGSFASAIAGVLFLYVFFTQEKVVSDLRRIRNAFN